jgi:hypothetical protein
MKGRWIVITSLAAATAGSGGCAKRFTEPPPQPVAVSKTVRGEGQVAQVNTIQAEATVVSADARRRRITLRGPDGHMETFRVGAEVRNLGRVRRGDRVVATYVEAVAFRLVPRGGASPGVTEDSASDRAALGQLPGAAQAQSVTAVARITAINRATHTVSLKGSAGRTIKVTVPNSERLANVRVGDLVEATFIEGAAISVEPAPRTT